MSAREDLIRDLANEQLVDVRELLVPDPGVLAIFEEQVLAQTAWYVDRLLRPCARCGVRLVYGTAEDLTCCDRCAADVGHDVALDDVRALHEEWAEIDVDDFPVTAFWERLNAVLNPTPQSPLPGHHASAASTPTPLTGRDPAKPHTPAGQGNPTQDGAE